MDNVLTKEEADLRQQLTDKELLVIKMEIENYVEERMIELFAVLRNDIAMMKTRQDEINNKQLVLNNLIVEKLRSRGRRKGAR